MSLTILLHTPRTASENILELGAGTAIAAILCMKKGASVTVQELADAMPHTLQCLKMNRTEAKKVLACRWGEECVQLATDGPAFSGIGAAARSAGTQQLQESRAVGPNIDCAALTGSEQTEDTRSLPSGGKHSLKQVNKKRKKSHTRTPCGVCLGSIGLDIAGRGQTLYDRVVMADVLYHAEDFSALISTVVHCIKPKGVLVLVYEQRRKNLDSFVTALASLFYAHEAHTVSVERAEDAGGGGGSLGGGSTALFQLHIFRSRIPEL